MQEIQSYEPCTLWQLMEFARYIADSGLIPAAVRGHPVDVVLVCMRGRELGLTTMQSLASVYVVEGRTVLSAELLVALARRHPDCLAWRMVESTIDRATYETQRRGDASPTRMTYTIEDARRAGLTGKPNWQRHPAAMLRARCASALARAVYSDSLLGVYTEDEGEEIVPRVAVTTDPDTDPAPDPVSTQADPPPSWVSWLDEQIHQADRDHILTYDQAAAIYLDAQREGYVTDGTFVDIRTCLLVCCPEVPSPKTKNAEFRRAVFRARKPALEVASPESSATPADVSGRAPEAPKGDDDPERFSLVARLREYVATQMNRHELERGIEKHIDEYRGLDEPSVISIVACRFEELGVSGMASVNAARRAINARRVT